MHALVVSSPAYATNSLRAARTNAPSANTTMMRGMPALMRSPVNMRNNHLLYVRVFVSKRLHNERLPLCNDRRRTDRRDDALINQAPARRIHASNAQGLAITNSRLDMTTPAVIAANAHQTRRERKLRQHGSQSALIHKDLLPEIVSARQCGHALQWDVNF